MADPVQVIRILDIRGCAVFLRDGRLMARMVAGGPIPDDMVAVLRHFKPLIVATLEARAAANEKRDAA